MDTPKKPPPRELIPVISLGKWKPDPDAIAVAFGKKPEKKRG